MKPDHTLQQFCDTAIRNQLSDADPYDKDAWHRQGRCIARRIATALGLTKFDVRSNKAGIAVSGEITLHAEHIYIQFSQSCMSGMGFMYRSCQNSKDYTGGYNHWMAWETLRNDWDEAIKKFETVMQQPACLIS